MLTDWRAFVVFLTRGTCSGLVVDTAVREVRMVGKKGLFCHLLLCLRLGNGAARQLSKKKRRRSSRLLKLDGVGGFLGIGALTLPFSLGAAAFWELEAGLVEGSFAFFVVAFFAAAH